jgi:ADP-ribosylglycohydrolase/predicted enzyme related to lactoylglutathione lyase
MADLSDRGVAAFVGAAVGDALGWPQENRSSNVDRKMPPPAMAFRSWLRRGGGRFNAYEEVIAAGEYSDDTQMILAGARSLTKGELAWSEWLTGVELPAFSVYQRGGGRALLAACRAWAAGVAPWQPHRDTDPSSYFNAGGNGGAMRVLPHALAAAAAGDPISTNNVFCDAVATHGHPRAVVGALVQAVAIRTALTVNGTLGYGELLDVLLDNPAAWATVPEEDAMPTGWLAAWSVTVRKDFEGTWRATVVEMTDLLLTARKGMAAGALASEQETLLSLGSTGTKTVGSGTVSAAGAVFLASRSAANPRAGLLSAAFLPKADTDTLASMTASILAAFAGNEWLAPLGNQVQDIGYITELAKAVIAGGTRAESSQAPVRKTALERFIKRLEQASPGDTVQFVDGRRAIVEDKEMLTPKTQSSIATRQRLAVEDGQTLHIVRVHRKPRGESEAARPEQQELLVPEGAAPHDSPSVIRMGVKLSVSHLDAMRHFYEDVLGLSPTRSGPSFVTFNDILALTASRQPEAAVPSRLSIYVEVLHIDALWRRVQEHGFRVLDPLDVEAGRRRFRCLDPEGNALEVRDGAQNSPDGGGD